MVDMHTHVLPSLDDGAKNLEESLGMLRALASQGVSDVVLTPHFYCEKMTVSKFLSKRAASYRLLLGSMHGINIRLRLGAEVHISDFRVGDYSEFLPLKIEDTRHILIELPFDGSWNEQVYKNLTQIIEDTRLIPIIAHAEKYPAVASKPQIADKLLEMGCLLQLNCNSLKNSKKKFAAQLVKRGKIQCLGSDTHNLEGRYPRYGEGFSNLKEIIGEKNAEGLQENMRTVLAGGTVRTEKTPPVRKLFGIYY